MSVYIFQRNFHALFSTAAHKDKNLLIAPAGFWSRGQNPRRHPISPRVYTYKEFQKCKVVSEVNCSTAKKSRFDQTRRVRSSRVIFHQVRKVLSGRCHFATTRSSSLASGRLRFVVFFVAEFHTSVRASAVIRV